MLRVGLTGGLASGKSAVAAMFAEFGCFVVHADRLGHEVLAPNGEAYGPVVAEFGRGILDPEGRIVRRALAAEVFGDPRRLETLTRLVHPPVLRREDELLRNYFQRQPDGIGVVEAAILIESGSYRRYDRIVLCVCDERLQVERAMARDGMTEADVRARLRHQMPLLDKVRYAHHVIDTSGTLEETRRQAVATLEALRLAASSVQMTSPSV